jgi:SAM-dependent methyltransferase
MILPQLLWRFARHRDDREFYALQATDAIRWLESSGIHAGHGREALDLGCGHGVFGLELQRRGWKVLFADATNLLLPELFGAPFTCVDLDAENWGAIGESDLVVCSNVLEHLRHPREFLKRAHLLVRENGSFYLSWTNWLSPWGGHEFSPWHYLGPKVGARIYDALSSRARFHQPGANLFPTSIGKTIRWIRNETEFEILRVAPRYYTELEFLMGVPGLREFAAWNCAILMRRRRGNQRSPDGAGISETTSRAPG